MSFTRVALYTANPSTTRGESTKLSASKEKIVYTNGKTVFVSCARAFPFIIASEAQSKVAPLLRYAISPSVPFHARTHTFTNPVRTPRSECRTVATSRTRPSHAYLRRATTVLLPTRWAPVRTDLFITAASFHSFCDPSSRIQVRVWDIVGEDQSLKGEHKVFSGKMCGLLSFCATVFSLTPDHQS